MESRTQKRPPESAILPSVNLKLDGYDPCPILENFHLSRKGVGVLLRALESLNSRGKERAHRVSTLSAPPGSGKSYLALFIGSLLYKSREWAPTIESTISRSHYAGERLRAPLKEYQKGEERLLPVYLVGVYPDSGPPI